MVIVGGGMAGARAVVTLRASGWQGPITLIGGETLLPYDRPPLSKAMITDGEAPAPALLLDRGMVESLDARVIIGHRAVAIDRAARTVALDDGYSIPYEKLLIATGASPRRLAIPGGEHALTLRDYGDGIKLRGRLRDARQAVIIGGGFIGLEVAASARMLGCAVTLIEAQPRILMRGVPAEIAAVVHDRHVAAGLTMQLGTGLSAVTPDGVILSDGRRIAADVVIAGIGATPETALAAAAGLETGNGITCDAELRTSDPNIFAAGDCCSFPHALYGGARIRLEAWRNATDQADVATANMLGQAKAHMAVPWFWSDQFDLSLQIAGLPGEGVSTVRRDTGEGAFVIFHIDHTGRLVAASGIGPGNAVARDIKLAEMMIARRAIPDATALADTGQPLKKLLQAAGR